MKHEPVFGLPVAHLAAHACKRKEFVPSLIAFFFYVHTGAVVPGVHGINAVVTEPEF